MGIPKYEDISEQGILTGEAVMTFTLNKREQVKLNANPNGPISGGSPIWLWGRPSVLSKDRFTEADVPILDRLWNGMSDVCISMKKGPFPKWVMDTNWTSANIKVCINPNGRRSLKVIRIQPTDDAHAVIDHKMDQEMVREIALTALLHYQDISAKCQKGYPQQKFYPAKKTRPKPSCGIM